MTISGSHEYKARLVKTITGKALAALLSRRAWLALASCLAITLSEYLNIPEDVINQWLAVVVAWIVGDSLRKTD